MPLTESHRRSIIVAGLACALGWSGCAAAPTTSLTARRLTGRSTAALAAQSAGASSASDEFQTVRVRPPVAADGAGQASVAVAGRGGEMASAELDRGPRSQRGEEIARISYQEGGLDRPADAAAPPAASPADDEVRPLLSPPEFPAARPLAPEEFADSPAAVGGLTLDEVVGAVYRAYPLLQSALYQRNIALGDQIVATGEFDLKLKGASENGPTGFYQTYRHSVGVTQPLYGGGEVFAGYRIGRGDYQPWYLERQTNDGGEFKAGVGVPLLQNAAIDPRRSALWQAQYGRQLAEPDIQAQLIGFVREASYAYWNWIAAGEYYRIAERVLKLAEERTDRIRDQVQAELIDPPELTDNLRLVAERRAKLADARRKLDQSAAKLSLYLRDPQGCPLLPPEELLAPFPDPRRLDETSWQGQIELALQSRPELKALDWQRRQIEVEYAQAENLTLPELDALLSGSQDVGQPTSKKRDKSEFELEASLYLNVPVQRRKARGKLTALEGKLAQLSAKRRMVADKIVVDVQYARVALESALTQVEQTRQAVEYAEDLADRERQNFDEGLSDLLKVTLREQYAVESAQKSVDALLLYYESEADLRAALGLDRLPR